MRARRRRVITSSSQPASGQVLALSLFIMMLAFFIVLNAISTFEEKKIVNVLTSVGTTFGADIPLSPAEINAPSVRDTLEAGHGEGYVPGRLRDLFTAAIPGHEVAFDKGRGVMRMRLPLADLNNAIATLIRNDDGGETESIFLSTLSALVRAGDHKVPWRMDIFLHVPENPSQMERTDPEALADYRKQATTLSRTLERAGLQQKLMSAGLKKGQPGTVDLYFRAHIPFSPLGEKQENKT